MFNMAMDAAQVKIRSEIMDGNLIYVTTDTINKGEQVFASLTNLSLRRLMAIVSDFCGLWAFTSV